MTAQDHIDAIGRAVTGLEAALPTMRAAHADMGKAIARVEGRVTALHARLDRAQKAYLATRDGSNIVAFSGGNDKPPVNDPDETIKP